MNKKEKAQIVLKARDDNDPRFVAFVVLMQARTVGSLSEYHGNSGKRL